MQKVLTAQQMREVDRLTTERYGIPSILLMENAAHAVARVITEKLGGSVEGKLILILCGKGNNGGDGAAIARLLSTEGALVRLVLFAKIEQTKGDARTNFECLPVDVEVCEAEEWWQAWEYINPLDWDELECVVDAVFGTGLKY
ncbi:MAG: NAD(P)H-hydrate epimerase [Pyrinomonadaceae bacterium]